MAIDGLPIVLVDTAGLRDGGDDIEKMGIARAERELARADLVLWLGDDEPEQGDCAVILVSPKSDIRAPEAGRVAVSAITADGLDALRIRIGSSLVDRTPTPAQVAFSAREIAELEKVVAALERAHDASPIFQAEDFRFARTALDRIVGRTGLEDVLDTIFGRFCLGK
jgi:tRNA modification GTPase